MPSKRAHALRKGWTCLDDEVHLVLYWALFNPIKPNFFSLIEQKTFFGFINCDTSSIFQIKCVVLSAMSK